VELVKRVSLFAILVFFVSLITIPFSYNSSFAESDFSISSDSSVYDYGEVITITGKISNYDASDRTDISLRIMDPNNFLIKNVKSSVNDDGIATFTFVAGETTQGFGTYTVVAKYGSEQSETTFYYINLKSESNLSISTEKGIFEKGDTITVLGKASDKILDSNVAIAIFYGDTLLAVDTVPIDVYGNFKTTAYTQDPVWEFSGVHTVRAATSGKLAETTFILVVDESNDNSYYEKPPLILAPSEITVDASSVSGARVEYSVKVIDEADGVLNPSCDISSGSVFPIGESKVTCTSMDSSGNISTKSFVVTVNASVLIPSWVKNVASFWCNNEIDDASYIEAVEFLVDDGVILVHATQSVRTGSDDIPSWIKNNACWWSHGLISDDEFATGIQYMIHDGIIRV